MPTMHIRNTRRLLKVFLVLDWSKRYTFFGLWSKWWLCVSFVFFSPWQLQTMSEVRALNLVLFTVFFNSCFVLWQTRLIHNVKWHVLQMCEQLEHLRTNFNYFVPFQSKPYQFNSRIVTTPFASQTTWNHRGMITETQSYILRCVMAARYYLF